MGGIAAARGQFVIMGDADDSYDFVEVPAIRRQAARRLRPRAGLPAPVAAAARSSPARCRSSTAGGATRCSRGWPAGGSTRPIHDIYCGMRGFTKELYDRLDQRCTGMEFATEMIIKASLHGERIAEVPITLHPDGRKAHPPHLKTFRDGWRTLRFFLLYSPRWLFLMPGLLMILVGPGRLRRSPCPALHPRRARSTPTRCSSPAWRSSAATSRFSSPSSPRCSRSAEG